MLSGSAGRKYHYSAKPHFLEILMLYGSAGRNHYSAKPHCLEILFLSCSAGRYYHEETLLRHDNYSQPSQVTVIPRDSDILSVYHAIYA